MEELGLLPPQTKELETPDVAAVNYNYIDPLQLSEDDLYVKLKNLKKQIEFIQIQEDYIKDEQKNLKKEYRHAQEEVKRIKSVPLVIGQFLEAVDQNTGILGSTTGSNYYVRILSTIDRELLKPGASVALHKHSNALVDVLPPEADSCIAMLQPGLSVFVLNSLNSKSDTGSYGTLYVSSKLH
ncbi:26s proteasome regulatory subunit 6B [Clonorchis sinensis]|uniref:26s proteasome regulatory subunit 6B n=1 Tax=Clonorchis sinensis TaxID=79923 RepID=A0A8T1MHH5_CLOSI|nr:26s proteasome regulatory subunit 6B [Clonorchis sinensis]